MAVRWPWNHRTIRRQTGFECLDLGSWSAQFREDKRMDVIASGHGRSGS